MADSTLAAVDNAVVVAKYVASLVHSPFGKNMSRDSVVPSSCYGRYDGKLEPVTVAYRLDAAGHKKDSHVETVEPVGDSKGTDGAVGKVVDSMRND